MPPWIEAAIYSQWRRRLLLPGLAAAAGAAVAVTGVAALAMAVGVDFELPDGGESIPLLGFTQLTLASCSGKPAGSSRLRKRHPGPGCAPRRACGCPYH